MGVERTTVVTRGAEFVSGGVNQYLLFNVPGERGRLESTC